MKLQIDIVHRVAKEVMKEKKVKLTYLVGTMIEIPRAALVADEIAEDAEFFSFGTNDLTQTTLGMSRDDSGSFLPAYAELDIVATNPFASIDQQGVGKLMEMTRDLGRKTRPKIKLGICGEHGGEPSSVKFCHRLGLDYVSCSPFRVPIARLAAAQAALRDLALRANDSILFLFGSIKCLPCFPRPLPISFRSPGFGFEEMEIGRGVRLACKTTHGHQGVVDLVLLRLLLVKRETSLIVVRVPKGPFLQFLD